MTTAIRAFRPLADTINVAVAATATPLTFIGVRGTMAVRLCNIGTQTVFFRFREAGDSTDATLSNALPIPAGQTEIFTLSNGTTSVSTIAASTGSTLYLTLGEGI